jgi:4-alpha-glucanotransferase
MVTDLLGTSQRFNQPGSSSNSNWSERLPVSLAEYARHAGYQAKLEKLKQEIVETGRG